MAAARIAAFPAPPVQFRRRHCRRSLTSALLLDAMGTLLTFEPPAPRLRAALRAATGADVGEAAAAARDPRRDRPLPRAPAPGRRRRRAGGAAPDGADAMRPALPEPAASLPATRSSAALLEALRFHAYPEVPGRWARCGAAGSGSSSSPTGTSRCTSGSPSWARAAARRGARVGGVRRRQAGSGDLRGRARAGRRRAGGRLARRRLARGRRRPARCAAGVRPVLVARDGEARAARRHADRGARRPTLLGRVTSVPPPSGPEPLLRPELPDGLPPERIPPLPAPPTGATGSPRGRRGRRSRRCW